VRSLVGASPVSTYIRIVSRGRLHTGYTGFAVVNSPPTRCFFVRVRCTPFRPGVFGRGIVFWTDAVYGTYVRFSIANTVKTTRFRRRATNTPEFSGEEGEGSFGVPIPRYDLEPSAGGTIATTPVQKLRAMKRDGTNVSPFHVDLAVSPWPSRRRSTSKTVCAFVCNIRNDDSKTYESQNHCNF